MGQNNRKTGTRSNGVIFSHNDYCMIRMIRIRTELYPPWAPIFPSVRPHRPLPPYPPGLLLRTCRFYRPPETWQAFSMHIVKANLIVQTPHVSEGKTLEVRVGHFFSVKKRDTTDFVSAKPVPCMYVLGVKTKQFLFFSLVDSRRIEPNAHGARRCLLVSFFFS